MADHPATSSPQDTLGTEGNPIHVVSRKEDDPIVSRPAPTFGWAGVMSGVEEFDREEIQGYKEDMDALLVFIGLFSAVLASFVAMSYSSLSANPADSMVFVMMGMSIQAASYTITGSFINSTTPAPTSLPAFEPTHNAIVVNILWTGSLIASLSTASGALLVKQWLRQYTTSKTSFAMYKMRIRNFRRAALEDWYVLEIASALPFLLQMSLALFFVGLCYFTADVHSSVKNTTLPLVSAWAFFFVAATISPIFSVRCPYKTPALDRLISALRGYLRRMLIMTLEIYVAIATYAHPGKLALAGLLLLAINLLQPLAAACVHLGELALSGLLLLAINLLQPLVATCTHPGEWTLAGLLPLSIKVLHPFSKWLGIIRKIPSTVHEWAKETLGSMKVQHDEAAAMQTNTKDLQILLRADKLHGNDEVADAAISHAVRQSNIDWKEALELTKSLILNRLPSQDIFSGTPKLVELGDLTPRALAAVHNVLDYVESCHPWPQDIWEDSPFLESVFDPVKPESWTFFLRLSVSLKQPPTTLPRWLDRCSEDDCAMLGTICQPTESAQVLRSLLALLCQRLDRPDFDLSKSLSRLKLFLEVYFERLDVPDSFTLNQGTSWRNVLNNESLGPTVAWLTQRLKSDIATLASGSSNDRSRETALGTAVSLIVKLTAVSRYTSVFDEIPPVAVKSSETLRNFWISCFEYRLHVSELLVPQYGIDADGLLNIKTAIVALASDPPAEIDGEKALILCRDLCVSLRYDHGDVRASNLVLAWRGVFAALTQLVQRTQVEDSDDARHLVNWCLPCIKDVDAIDDSDDDAKYTAWLVTFKPEDSPVPDELISELLRINPNPHDPVFEGSYLRLWRVRRLNDLSDDAQSQAKGTSIRHALDTPPAMSGESSDNQGSDPQPSALVADDGNIQTDPMAPHPIDSHGPLPRNGTSNEVPRTVTGIAMAVTTNNATPESAPDVTAAGTHNSLRHLDSHIHALHALSTAAQRLAEALLAELPAEDTDPSGSGACIRSERPAATVTTEESMVIASTTVPGEDVTVTCQVEAAGSDTSNRDEQVPERRSVQAPDVAMSTAPSLPTGTITQGNSSQDIPSEHNEGGKRSGTSPGTSIAVHGAVNHQLEADMENASTDLYSAPTTALSFPSYDHRSKPDRSPESSRRESLREEAFNTRSSVDEDGKELTHAMGPSGGDAIEPTDAVNTGNNETTVSPVHGGPVYSVRRGNDDGDQSRDGGGNVSAREGTEDGGSGDHP